MERVGSALIVEAKLSAQSRVLKIEETIELEWNIDATTFNWIGPFMHSTGTKVTDRIGLNGTYLCKDTGLYVPRNDDPLTVEIKNFGNGNKFLYRGTEYVITGLFSACYDAGQGIKHNLSIGSDYIHESPYGWLTHLDDKIK